jgi:hypothetical protein
MTVRIIRIEGGCTPQRLERAIHKVVTSAAQCFHVLKWKGTRPQLTRNLTLRLKLAPEAMESVGHLTSNLRYASRPPSYVPTLLITIALQANHLLIQGEDSGELKA